MVSFSDMIGSSMADMKTPSNAVLTSAPTLSANIEHAESPNDADASIYKAMVKSEMGSTVDDAQALVTEVTEQMAILNSMQEDLNPERVASLLMMPEPMG